MIARPKYLLSFLIAGVFIILVVMQADWNQAKQSLSQANINWIVLAIILLILDYLIRTYRWFLMLRCFNKGIRLSVCLGPFWGSFAINNVVPLRAGDLLRIAGFQKQLKVSVSQATGTLIIERFFDLLALLLILIAAIMLIPGAADNNVIANLVAFAFGGTLLAALVIFAIPLKLAQLLQQIEKNFNANSVIVKILRLGSEVFKGINRLKTEKIMLSLSFCTVAAWLLEGLVFICVLLSLNIDSAVSSGWLALAIGTLSTLIPSTPGYAGTFDYFTTLAITITGTGTSVATVAAILIHIVLWLPITCIGGILLWRHYGSHTLQRIRDLKKPNE